VLSALFATVVGIAFGVYAAIRRHGVIANAVMTVSLIGVSLPTFLIGIGLIWIFAVECQRWLPAVTGALGGWVPNVCLPSFGRGETVRVGGWTTGLLTESGLRSLVLPVLTLGFFQLTLIMRLVRSEMLEVMRSDFIRFARARGLPNRVIEFRHALRNTMIPVVTIAGLQLGSVIAFAIVTETVFQWPGLGALFVNAVQFADVPVMAAYLVFVAFVFVITNLAVDLAYLALDPRLRTATMGAR
jgi:peptide/nickel transport system permease protein